MTACCRQSQRVSPAHPDGGGRFPGRGELKPPLYSDGLLTLIFPVTLGEGCRRLAEKRK